MSTRPPAGAGSGVHCLTKIVLCRGLSPFFPGFRFPCYKVASVLNSWTSFQSSVLPRQKDEDREASGSAFVAHWLSGYRLNRQENTGFAIQLAHDLGTLLLHGKTQNGTKHSGLSPFPLFSVITEYSFTARVMSDQRALRTILVGGVRLVFARSMRGDERKELGLTERISPNSFRLPEQEIRLVSPSGHKKGDDEAFQSDVERELQAETANAFQPSLH